MAIFEALGDIGILLAVVPGLRVVAGGVADHRRLEP